MLFDEPAPPVLTVAAFTCSAAAAALLPVYLTRRMQPLRKAARRNSMLVWGVPLLFGAMIAGSLLVPSNGEGVVRLNGVDTGDRVFFRWTMGEMLLRSAVIAVAAFVSIWAVGAAGEWRARRGRERQFETAPPQRMAEASDARLDR